MQLLLVEDNVDLAANIGEFLESRGHSVDFAYDGVSGLRLATSSPYDVLVLDVSLPGLDGLALCQRIREGARRNLPVLMLTARDTEEDKLQGFDAGADDYLTKPFSLLELLARLQALHRRALGHDAVLEVADLVLDPRAMTVHRAGERVVLPPIAFQLLEQLMRASPGVVTRAQLEQTIWGDAPPGSDAALRGHVRALRTAIDQGRETRLLHTVHGTGYRIAVDGSV